MFIEQFPERIPFRLTRMLIRAMEISGIEGSYRNTCEKSMNVLRESRDSLIAMLEAFVYDPLISWRFLADMSNPDEDVAVKDSTALSRKSMKEVRPPVNSALEDSDRSINVNPISEGADEDASDNEDLPTVPSSVATLPSRTPSKERLAAQSEADRLEASRARSLRMYSDIQALAARLATDSHISSIAGDQSDHIAAEGSLAFSRLERSMKQREFMSLLGGENGAAHEEALNKKAIKLIRRVEDKLAGTDFPDCDEEPLDVQEQVQRLIVQATSVENLCQLFVGWCAFW